MLLTTPLLFSAALAFQPPAVGGGFDDPNIEPPVEESGAPIPGEFDASPFDDAPQDPPAMEVEAEIDPDDPFAPPPTAPPNPLLDPPPADAGVLIEADDLPPVRPEIDEPAPLPLDPADPDVVEIVEPEATILVDPEPNPLRELIRNPYDIFDLREHAAIPADCLLARQACLPCTRTVTSCVGCCGGTTTETIPVQGVNPAAAEQIGQILLARTPGDARVQYLMFVLRYREMRYDEAFDFLEQAVTLERANPFPNYDRFMEPIQGRARVYLERVRNLAGVAG